MQHFLPTNNDLFFSRGDANDPRLGELARHLAAEATDKLQAKDWVIAGYPDDEGIRLGGGRAGAQGGPDAIRGALYKFTPYLQHRLTGKLCDIGNLNVQAMPLAQRHEVARDAALKVFSRGARWLALGGGHDYAYADGAAFLKIFRQTNRRAPKPLLINIDAHPDVRPTDRGLSSGTPFFRLLEEFDDFELLQIAIQPQSCSLQHMQWAQKRDVAFLTLPQMRADRQGAAAAALKFLRRRLKRARPTFLSFDIDAFAACHAMGCSQAFPTGLSPEEGLAIARGIAAQSDLRGAGIYEVAPALDLDQRTARLAALLAHQLVFDVR